MDKLRAWAGVDSSNGGRHRLLSTQEIEASGKGHLFDMGAHTGTHPLLSAMSGAAQRQEIQQSKSYLEKLIERRVVSFAFPYGDYNTETLGIVREEGFSSACGTKSGSVRPNTNWFELPRRHVQDWDGATFEKHLADWFA
jgi:peptidoglycan/xylan/chitin deacetylase (PgdA/CDA1 family)